MESTGRTRGASGGPENGRTGHAVPGYRMKGLPDARLWEIAENLHRAELTEPERRQHIAEWVRLTAEKVRHGAAPVAGGTQPAEQGIRKAAKELGIDERSVRRAVAAESLPDPVKAAADEAGLGTVARAQVARETTPEAQVAQVAGLALAGILTIW